MRRQVAGGGLVVAGERRDLRERAWRAASPVSSRSRSPASCAIAHASSKRPSIASSSARRKQRPRVRVVAGRTRVERPQRLVCRASGPRTSAVARPNKSPTALPGEPRVADGACSAACAHSSNRPRKFATLPERVQTRASPAWSPAASSERQRRSPRASRARRLDASANVRARVAATTRRKRLAGFVAGCARLLGRGLRRWPLASLARPRARSRGRARGGRRAEAAASARALARAAARRARSSPRHSARRPAAARRSPARSASSGSGCPSSAL